MFITLLFIVLLMTRALRIFCSDFPDNITRIIISHTDYKNNLSTKKQIGFAARSVAYAKGGCGARVFSVSRINARRLRGNRNDLITHGLSNLLVVELRVSSRGHEPKIKPAQGRFDFWLGRTDSNHDKENQNLLSYH